MKLTTAYGNCTAVNRHGVVNITRLGEFTGYGVEKKWRLQHPPHETARDAGRSVYPKHAVGSVVYDTHTAC